MHNHVQRNHWLCYNEYVARAASHGVKDTSVNMADAASAQLVSRSLCERRLTNPFNTLARRVTNLLPGTYYWGSTMKYEAPSGLKRIPNNFNHRLGGAPTPDVDRGPRQAPKVVPKQMSQVELDFNIGNHLPTGKIVK